ncbi:MAG: class B sortase [Lachnospiraceae bacterium]|nr:class B sortase [Lachnospiraceae bacterium]
MNKIENDRKKGGLSSFLFYLFPFLCLAVLAVSLWFFVPEYLEYKAAKESYARVQEQAIHVTGQETVAKAEKPVTAVQAPAAVQEETQEPAEETITYPGLDIGFDELAGMNEDFIGVIYMPVLEMLYPVVHSKDNEDYLHTTFMGEYNFSGCIFMDCLANRDLTDRNTLIFGHNMKNGTMFGSLKKFSADPELCPKDPYFYIYTPGKVYKYRIFAYNQLSVRDSMYATDAFYETDEEYDRFVEECRERSQYHPADLEVDFGERPPIVTLSTCWGTEHTYYFIVQGALIGTAEL